jgi:hypothetical protein
LGTRTIVALASTLAMLVAVGVIWMRERTVQRRLTERVARSVAAKLQGSLRGSGRQWRIDAVCGGRPVVLVLAGKFLARGDLDSGPDFVPSLDIEVVCSTSAQLSVHSNSPGGAAYLRDLWASARGSKVTTGATDFDSKFLVWSPDLSNASLLDKEVRQRFLASQSAAHGHSIEGHSWAIRVGGGVVESHEVFNEGGHAADEMEMISDTLSRVALLCSLAASAETNKPARAIVTP